MRPDRCFIVGLSVDHPKQLLRRQVPVLVATLLIGSVGVPREAHAFVVLLPALHKKRRRSPAHVLRGDRFVQGAVARVVPWHHVAVDVPHLDEPVGVGLDRGAVPLLRTPIQVVDYSDHVEEVRDELALDLLVERTFASEARTQVDFEEPWVELVVHEDIEAKELEAVRPALHILGVRLSQDGVHTQEGLVYYVVDFLEYRLVVDAVASQHFSERFQAPFAASYAIFAIFVVSLLESFLVQLVEAVVGEVRELGFARVERGVRVGCLWRPVFGRCEADKAFIVDIDLQRIDARERHVHS